MSWQPGEYVLRLVLEDDFLGTREVSVAVTVLDESEQEEEVADASDDEPGPDPGDDAGEDAGEDDGATDPSDGDDG